MDNQFLVHEVINTRGQLYVEIIDGLEDGQEVIIGPYRTLKNMHAGDAVKVEEKKADQDEEEEDSGAVEVRVD